MGVITPVNIPVEMKETRAATNKIIKAKVSTVKSELQEEIAELGLHMENYCDKTTLSLQQALEDFKQHIRNSLQTAHEQTEDKICQAKNDLTQKLEEAKSSLEVDKKEIRKSIPEALEHFKSMLLNTMDSRWAVEKENIRAKEAILTDEYNKFSARIIQMIENKDKAVRKTLGQLEALIKSNKAEIENRIKSLSNIRTGKGG
jgi:gas vesicle protein